ncbi:M20 family metallopeptidase [Paraburkholderia sp. D15]|uniref:M20 aminoacylase family protein n=1 Tax=Paraburkholderia sp. D15 TaxID=2880218 RepID=UPI00247A08B1|nr:M20 aminoacylase family protein [Paraburkholderia sp. D15]WGS54684.1 M20 family metallopeptidase [Paraburkholderia sp. D15]
MKVIPEIQAAFGELQSIRHSLHQHPELRYEENRTAELIAERLKHWGLQVHCGLGKTGVVGLLKKGNGHASIGLRADMDALPVDELNTFCHRSTRRGHMHACGHDGHVAMLLGAARHLAERGDFDGTIVFIFQPAEEGGAGAQAMIDDGLFTRFPVDAVFALHNWPGLETGRFGVTAGPIMAASAEFRIDVSGVGSHAALPHLGHDPLFAAAQIYHGLQALVTRNKRPIDAAVLTVAQFHGGEKDNVIADCAWMSGTVRAFSNTLIDLFETRMREVATALASGHGCTASTTFRRSYPATVNDIAQTRFAVEVMREVVGTAKVDDNIEPTTTGEDFAFMLLTRPGCYALLGNGNGDHRAAGHGNGPCTLHNPSYDFNDELLPIGATYWVRLTERFLARRLANDS